MPREIEFQYDFGSPNAFLVHRAIPAIEARGKVFFRYVPVLLGGIFKAIGNQSPMASYGHISAKREYDQLEMERFMARHAIVGFAMNPHFPVNSLLAMRGAIAAEALGIAADYREAMFKAMWQDGAKLDDPEIWQSILNEAGLPSQALMQGAGDVANKQKLVANTQNAVACGVFGSPTFFLGEEMWFGKDRLRDVVEAAGGA